MAKRALIVDDSRSLRQMVNLVLSKSGFDVTEACDGSEGLTKIQSSAYDIVISDVNMPNLNGIGFLSEMKKTENGVKSPVVMLTTENQPEMKEEARKLGATAWLRKPFNATQIMKVVTQITQ